MSRLKGWQRTQNNILRSKERLTRRHSVMELGTVKLPQKIPENGSLTKDWECKQHWASQLQHCKPEDNGSRPSLCPGKIISNSMLSQIIIKNTLGILLHPTLNSWKSIYFLGPCSEHWSDKEIFFTITYFKKKFFFSIFLLPFKYSCFHFPTTTPLRPTHSHLPPSILPHFGFVPGSFIYVI